ARETIGGRVHRTPTLTSASLAREVGVPVYLKAELLQRTGSFKPRGVLNKLASLTAEEKSRGVIGISAGNHAQALAYGAALEGVDALIVMWQGVSEQKLEATRAYGGTVDLEATDPLTAFDRLDVLVAETGRTLVHGFDDPNVIAGHGPIALELHEGVPGPRGRVGARQRGRDRGRLSLPLRARQARLRTGRSGRSCGAPGRKSPAERGNRGRRCRLRRQRGGRDCGCYPGRAMKAGIHPEYVLATVHC